MKKILFPLFLLATMIANGQTYLLKAGDHFPDITLHPMINAPAQSLYLNVSPSKKLFIFNFWGTWCSPCIPEMDALAKLQDKFQQQIQIVGVADDPLEKLVKYNAKKPSKLWLISDTSFVLYHMLNLASVSQCIVVDAKRNIVAVLKTDSVNEKLISRLLKGEKIKSNADISEVIYTEKDPFGVDTLQVSSFTIRSYMKGQQTMGRTPTRGVFANRRKSYFNVGLVTMYKDAYDVVSQNQIVYDFDKKKYDNYSDKSQLYCFDLLVRPEEKDSLLLIMQRKLNESLPVKGRTEMRTMPVYVLKQKQGASLNISESTTTASTYNFSGNGYDGTAVTVEEFTHTYLNNELELPVINETGLTKRYDIKTSNDLRDKENILKAVDKLGLTLEKSERPVKVLILYAQPIVGYIMGTYK